MELLICSLGYALIPLIAFGIDTVYGDPRSNLHPVVLIGNMISFFESKLYPVENASPQSLLVRGIITVLFVLASVGIITGILVYLGAKSGFLLYASVGSVILYFTITPRSLARDGLEIYHLLKDENLVEARKKLSWIVGRDTENLDESDIARGTVETIAENTTDGIISPLFWYLVFGPVGAMLYRAGNTMDSMLGYKDERYLYFGRFAARLDDVLNYLPARITYLLFVAAAYVLKLDWKNAVLICRWDARKHPSPNGGYVEATVAGALHIRLGGYNYYEGKPEFREYMGDSERPLCADDIKETIMLMYGATVIFLVIETILLFVIGMITY